MKSRIYPFSIEISKAGDPTLKYKNNYLHSKYDPSRESQKLVDKINLEGKKCVIICGMGLGYHITPFISLRDRLKVLVIDKNPEILTCLKETHRFELFEKTKLFVGEISQLESWIVQQIEDDESESVLFFDHAPSINLNRNYYDKAKLIITNVLKIKLQSYLTTLSFSKRWHENILKNLCYLSSFKTIHTKVDFPVFIIGSGPGLDDQLKNLAELKKIGIIIALFPVYHRLIKENIEPHFVISTDGGIANRIHSLPEDQINKDSCAVCITTLSVTPHLFRLWKGDFLLIDHQLPLEQYLLENVPIIPMQGNVASAAFLLSKKISSGPIFLIGMDFAFTNRQYHYKGNRLEDYMLFSTNKFRTFNAKLYDLISKFQLVLVPGHDGKMMTTNLAMQSYLHWFQKTIFCSDQSIYTIGKKGAFIQGSVQTTFEEIRKRFLSPSKEFNPRSILKPFSRKNAHTIQKRLIILLKEYQKLEQSFPENFDWNLNRVNPDFKEIFSFSESRLLRKVRKKKGYSSDEHEEFIISVKRSIALIKRFFDLKLNFGE